MFTYRDYYDIISAVAGEDIKLFLRHDVDMSTAKALEMAERERKMRIGPAVYFIMVTSEFYNPFEKESAERINKILDLGHRIGLHYDLSLMPDDDRERSRIIATQAMMLEGIFGQQIIHISAHKPFMGVKPSIDLLEALRAVNLDDVNHKLDNYKYISDSGMIFRDDPFVVAKNHKLIHLNIHPEWWSTKEMGWQEKMLDLDLEYDMRRKVFSHLKHLKSYREKVMK